MTRRKAQQGMPRGTYPTPSLDSASVLVACPYCGERAGRQCVLVQDGTAWHMRPVATHVERIRAADRT